MWEVSQISVITNPWVLASLWKLSMAFSRAILCASGEELPYEQEAPDSRNAASLGVRLRVWVLEEDVTVAAKAGEAAVDGAEAASEESSLASVPSR